MLKYAVTVYNSIVFQKLIRSSHWAPAKWFYWDYVISMLWEEDFPQSPIFQCYTYWCWGQRGVVAGFYYNKLNQSLKPTSTRGLLPPHHVAVRWNPMDHGSASASEPFSGDIKLSACCTCWLGSSGRQSAAPDTNSTGGSAFCFSSWNSTGSGCAPHHHTYWRCRASCI